MKRAYFLLGLLALGCLCSPGSCFLFHIFEEPAPQREFPVQDLLVDATVFPESWQTWRGPEPIPERERGERESFYVAFRYEGLEPGILGACHQVFRYRNRARAAASFASHGFLKRHLITPWAPPEGSSYKSPLAGRFRFECAEVDIVGVPYSTCEVVAQYDEFISEFWTNSSPGYLTLRDFERILVAIDERMALHLGEDTH